MPQIQLQAAKAAKGQFRAAREQAQKLTDDISACTEDVRTETAALSVIEKKIAGQKADLIKGKTSLVKAKAELEAVSIVAGNGKEVKEAQAFLSEFHVTMKEAVRERDTAKEAFDAAELRVNQFEDRRARHVDPIAQRVSKIAAKYGFKSVNPVHNYIKEHPNEFRAGLLPLAPIGAYVDCCEPGLADYLENQVPLDVWTGVLAQCKEDQIKLQGLAHTNQWKAIVYFIDPEAANRQDHVLSEDQRRALEAAGARRVLMDAVKTDNRALRFLVGNKGKLWTLPVADEGTSFDAAFEASTAIQMISTRLLSRHGLFQATRSKYNLASWTYQLPDRNVPPSSFLAGGDGAAGADAKLRGIEEDLGRAKEEMKRTQTVLESKMAAEATLARSPDYARAVVTIREAEAARAEAAKLKAARLSVVTNARGGGARAGAGDLRQGTRSKAGPHRQALCRSHDALPVSGGCAGG